MEWKKRYWLEVVLFLVGVGIQMSPLKGWELALVFWIPAVAILLWHLGLRLQWPVYRINTGAYREDGHSQSNISQVPIQIQQYADMMTTHLARDRDRLTRRIHVCNRQIDWHHIGGMDAYVQFSFEVFSSSVFDLDIGQKLDGHIKYEGHPLKDKPQVPDPLKALKRGDSKILVLRQFLSPEVVADIQNKAGKEICFDFSQVHIWLASKELDGSPGEPCKLGVPSEYRCQIPDKQELEHYLTSS